MKIALSYDLKSDYIALGWTPAEAAEFDSEATLAGIEGALRQLGHATERVGRCVELAKRLVAGQRWELVFNICEGAWGRSREAQAPALCELFDQLYTFCDPLTAALTLDKAMTKRVVRDGGLRTPAFFVVESLSDLERLTLPFPLFAKPLAEGTGKGIDTTSIVRDRASLERTCKALLAKHRQPVLIEEFLPGRETTVGIVGSGNDARVLGVMEVVLLEKAEKGVYSFHNKENWHGLVDYRLAEAGAFSDECAALALASYRLLGCRDAGRVDLRADAQGRPHFLEVNPLAGMTPEYSDLPILNGLTGRSYAQLVDDIVKSAMKRAGGRP